MFETISTATNPGNLATRNSYSLKPRPRLVQNDLQNLPQWVCWQQQDSPAGTKPKKMPISPHAGEPAKVNNPSTWGSFEEAVGQYEEQDHDGIGFVFTPGDPYLGIDLDNCRDPITGDLQPWAEHHFQWSKQQLRKREPTHTRNPSRHN